MTKPLLYNCEACNFRFELCLNSLLRVFFTEPLVDHILATCTFCKKENVIWNLHRMVITNALSKNPDPALKVQIDMEAAGRIWKKFVVAEEKRIERLCAELAACLEEELP